MYPVLGTFQWRYTPKTVTKESAPPPQFSVGGAPLKLSGRRKTGQVFDGVTVVNGNCSAVNPKF